MPEEAESFGAYYGNLDRKSDAMRNHFAHRYAQRVQHLVSEVADGVRVLDAGCGLGSESILCGMLGAKVTGVDLIEPWLNAGKKRLQFYEAVIGRPIPTELCAQSVFDIKGKFDVIWSQESISHIDPAEDFIAFAYDRLNKGGKLIISDPNKLNPLIFWNARRDAKKHGGLHSSFKNPQTGEMVPFAYERVFDVFSIKRLLLRNGFVIESFHHNALLPWLPRLNIRHRNISLYLEKVIPPILPLKWLAGIYTVVAAKV
jgi:SAM-dependent methyltransferase